MVPMMPIRRLLPLVLAAALAAPIVVPGVALAQGGEAPTQGVAGPATGQLTELQAQCTAKLAELSAAQRAAEGKEVKRLGPISRIFELGDDCLAELRTDADFRGFLDESLVFAIHKEEAGEFTEDQRHVIYAYAAIWVLTAGFIVFVFLRQQKLRAELARTQAELARIEAEEAGGK